MRKHGRNTHVHHYGSERLMQTPERGISRRAALRSLGEVVYAVRCGEVVKIGHTTNLGARFSELHATEVLAFMPGTRAEEQAIHDRLAAHVHHGIEWYYPTPGVLAVVNDMRERLGLEPVAA